MKIKMRVWNLVAWSFAVSVGSWSLGVGMITHNWPSVLMGVICIVVNLVQFIHVERV